MCVLCVKVPYEKSLETYWTILVFYITKNQLEKNPIHAESNGLSHFEYVIIRILDKVGVPDV